MSSKLKQLLNAKASKHQTSEIDELECLDLNKILQSNVLGRSVNELCANSSCDGDSNRGCSNQTCGGGSNSNCINRSCIEQLLM